MGDSLIQEYIKNITPLLDENEALFGLMVNRQIGSRLLPKLRGNRQELELDLWCLLHFCVEGKPPDELVLSTIGSPIALNDFAPMATAILANRNIAGDQSARFISAARETMTVFEKLREFGVYPPPVVG